MDIENYSTETLKREIERRESESVEMLELLSDDDIVDNISPVKTFLADNMRSIKNTGYPQKDFK